MIACPTPGTPLSQIDGGVPDDMYVLVAELTETESNNSETELECLTLLSL